MTSRQPDVVSQVDLALVVPGSVPLPVVASLRYDRLDPYAVHICFHTGGAGSTDMVEWTFARQLLADGLTRPTGIGDVRVWPSNPDAEGTSSTVSIALSSPSGHALFEAPREALLQFLLRTYAEVPFGAESTEVDLDAELTALLEDDVT
jgi:hypothetical protein